MANREPGHAKGVPIPSCWVYVRPHEPKGTLMTYQFHSKPFAHQSEVFDRTAELKDYALFWEQGCGKTKPTIDTAAHLFEQDKIDALVVVAPNGVHRNWITDELPAHMPLRVMIRTRMEYWQSSTAKNKGQQMAMDRLLKWDGLSILTISYDAFITETALAYLRKFFVSRRIMMVIDEAHSIKNPKAIRTKKITKASTLTTYRRALTGTPITKPFDIYAQINFLDDQFWRSKGISNYTAFKQYFGVWRTRQLGHNRSFQEFVEYKNLEQLEKWIAEKGHRLTKDECLDLPPKLYAKRRFDLGPDCQRAYDSLRQTCMLELCGETITTELAITLLLRLQQVTSGYIPGNDGKLHRLGDNARLDAFTEYAENIERQAIVWARFTDDVTQICERLNEIEGKGSCVRYDGQVGDDERAKAKAAFQAGDVKWFVGNPQAGATGLTLVGAKHVAYYSNSFRLIDRLQSEDRAHRIGQTDPVDYVDFIANSTVDEQIVKALREGFDIAGRLLGDQLREWI